ncbi:MAG: hypothetical protein HC817_08580 [Saprospiraceae bacterium]|nr:hypothetical protein [Saprospiraceae bacterium]
MKKLNKISLYFLTVFSFALLIAGCESEFDPIPFNESEIVVEGAIEAARSGEAAFPTYVILTKSQPFFSRI